ncbi:hypothetical protein GJ689_06485 [Rhodoplanes serenus]|uniref:Uncharacterized protein n=1 Tax=Rhodoplanes serenus TaxID=200615 RepID=A0A9X4XIV9_9BRAD|nr:hypothetical protein [Rhodoplanes serenus]MBI5112808.1 hypothetical protein [Rhodovulum sp.]MTW15853.1 hypothetical protein [Rhodoplanes serenus]
MTIRPIDSASRGTVPPPRPLRRVETVEPVTPAEPAAATSRALVSQAESRPPPRPAGRNLASFLAQLIATSRGLPQTRERRRAEPDEAGAAYRAALRAGGPPTAGRIARTA